MSKLPNQPSSRKNLTGAAIRRVRVRSKRRITQEDLVGRLAVQELFLTQAQIAKIESGTRPVKDYELIAIAKALRVSVQTIIDETLKAERQKRRDAP